MPQPGSFYLRVWELQAQRKHDITHALVIEDEVGSIDPLRPRCEVSESEVVLAAYYQRAIFENLQNSPMLYRSNREAFDVSIRRWLENC